ncbi:MAG: hypothetical protein AVDCRST_MAG73-28, partial [uncultured Thermomicrobiales bacterium]
GQGHGALQPAAGQRRSRVPPLADRGTPRRQRRPAGRDPLGFLRGGRNAAARTGPPGRCRAVPVRHRSLLPGPGNLPRRLGGPGGAGAAAAGDRQDRRRAVSGLGGGSDLGQRRRRL